MEGEGKQNEELQTAGDPRPSRSHASSSRARPEGNPPQAPRVVIALTVTLVVHPDPKPPCGLLDHSQHPMPRSAPHKPRPFHFDFIQFVARPAQSVPSSLRLGAPASLGSTSMTTPTDRSPPSPPRRISDPRLRASTLDSVAPYVPHQRTTRLAEKEVVEGVFPPALRAIPYTGKLPHPHMPTHLATTLSSGSRKEIIDWVWKAFLPRSVDSETYGPFFKNSTGLKSTAWNLEIYDIPNTTLPSTRTIPFAVRDEPRSPITASMRLRWTVSPASATWGTQGGCFPLRDSACLPNNQPTGAATQSPLSHNHQRLRPPPRQCMRTNARQSQDLIPGVHGSPPTQGTTHPAGMTPSLTRTLGFTTATIRSAA
ncbi:hypothetical protein PLEOSDRAFT_154632 [Pleurotus ostreatus PC15]|uniref:Uncharacterized protein n=1 Tax=Pleurotus ostreatus (strain PC15) TaxID=1137138 RepID=A0A067NWL4_PLEO1|nr:hypothetical protein PLEOSDRAFT_154632 [Pleurotus ostreatus PC15]